MELWENHALLASEQELEHLLNSQFPVGIYNTYVGFGAEEASTREQAANLATRLKAKGVKFNLGRVTEQEHEYIEQALAWRDLLPKHTRLLCECHAGSIMEKPEKAQEIFAAWEDPYFQAIVHPFERNLDRLKAWFACLGPRITHAHVQLRAENGVVQCLYREPKLVKEALHIMLEEGFTGTYTLEFTEGTSSPDENMETLFNAALNDLDFLQQCLA
jgi:hypothetical protein